MSHRSASETQTPASPAQSRLAQPRPAARRRARARQSGAAAILAMMFLVIFASLAAAMSIVAQGNLSSADSNYKVQRSLASAETGLRFLIYRINKVSTGVTTTKGAVTSANATTLWTQLATSLSTSLSGELNNLAEPTLSNGVLSIGPISVASGQPTFRATLTPHPIAGENYSSAYYQRPPYSQMTPAVSAAAPLDATWVRVKVWSADGATGHQVTRSIQVDFKLDKKIKYALLSKSRVMIGRNVMISGPVGSKFTETNLTNGHPIQVLSDFGGLDSTLDASLATFYNTLTTNDKNGDNRINLADANETAGITNPTQYDTNGDGFIDDYDFFLARFDSNGDKKLSSTELNTASNVTAAQLMAMIDKFGATTRAGYNDGFIDNSDRYAKIQGQVLLTADMASWQAGAAAGSYHNYVQGPIVPDRNASPIVFQSSDLNQWNLNASDFDVSSFRTLASGDLAAQATQQAAQYDANNPNSPRPLGTQVHESVPYGAAHPYDYYDRPVYENMTFTDVKIPKGSNALFKNCKFIGCTFVETTTANTDPNFNYVGMQLADGTLKHADKSATVGGQTVTDTKPLSNNIRFDSCKFEGAVVTDVTDTFTVARNKLSFTGQTTFDPAAASLSSTQKALYAKSSLMAPNYSVEIGTFNNPADAGQNVTLTGTIVGGVIDMRGQVTVDGTLLTTFQPVSNTGPVLGSTSPNYNTTLGYFPSATGDLEAEAPTGPGLGNIRIRYNATRALPDGINGPIQFTPTYTTYVEGGN
ncbi:MAG: hypothetical protein NTW19_24815 [Planctomycetota bacterium]|nr:hypothetical protein [Planctomycetota bacterium]